MTRAFMALVALLMLVALWLLLTRTRIGLVIQAALTHPEMVESLGHNVPRVFMLVFGSGCALAGPGRGHRRHHLRHRAEHGRVRGRHHLRGGGGRRHGLAGGRLPGLAAHRPDADLCRGVDVVGWCHHGATGQAISRALAYPILKITVSQAAPILPYLLLVLILIFRPKGLLGTREEADHALTRCTHFKPWNVGRILWSLFALVLAGGAAGVDQQPSRRPCCRRWASPSSPAWPTTCCWGKAAC
jgi:branched-chain amino acid transport system permease protein